MSKGGNNVSHVLSEMTIDRLHEMIKEGKTTTEAMIKYCLDRIEALDEKINAVILINPDA